MGDHGYDNSLPSMHPFLAAMGPSFRRRYRLSNLNSVDIYPLMCHLLSVPPRPNNGSLTQALSLLHTQRQKLDLSLVFTLTVGIVLVLFTIQRKSWSLKEDEHGTVYWCKSMKRDQTRIPGQCHKREKHCGSIFILECDVFVLHRIRTFSVQSTIYFIFLWLQYRCFSCSECSMTMS